MCAGCCQKHGVRSPRRAHRALGRFSGVHWWPDSGVHRGEPRLNHGAAHLERHVWYPREPRGLQPVIVAHVQRIVEMTKSI